MRSEAFKQSLAYKVFNDLSLSFEETYASTEKMKGGSIEDTGSIFDFYGVMIASPILSIINFTGREVSRLGTFFDETSSDEYFTSM
ncbi:hypothetical protein HNV12_03175 [Methanococcoides sp. SA1]|nr:hypothetical protein [Methanococcoides sp. SA1]